MRNHQNVRTLSLVVFTFTFLLIGAAVFDALESEMDERNQDLLGNMEQNMKRKYGITDDDYRVLETTIIKMEPHKAGPQWKFIGAFYFATVVLVMIGYGHSTPATVGGKAFVILYAIIGIPMGLIMFQHIGERLNKGASIIIKRLKILFRRKNPEITEIDLMVATFFLSTIITTSGAAMFSHYERWSYFESFYYCFITLTTIGFGDYVALQKDHALSEKPGYVAMALIFILFGLAVLAASMNLLVLRFMTMNTEEVKQLEADMQPASSFLSLDGESLIINGNMITQMSHHQTPETMSFVSHTSVCSCTCYPRHSPGGRDRYGSSRRPSRISHLLDAAPGDPAYDTETREEERFDLETPEDVYGRSLKRASV